MFALTYHATSPAEAFLGQKRQTISISEGAGRFNIISASRRARELKLGSKWGRIEFPIHWQCPLGSNARACASRGVVWGPKEAREAPKSSHSGGHS